MFKWKFAGVGYVLVFVLSFILYGCGETISQSATGGGSNVVNTGDSGTSSVVPAPVVVSSSGGSANGLPICDGTSPTAEEQDRCVAP